MATVTGGYRVRGRVQGVGFRAWAARRAEQLALAGWVRNARDGSVEVCVRGEAGAVQHYVTLLRDGPPLAHVSDIESFDPPADSIGTAFEIRY